MSEETAAELRPALLFMFFWGIMKIETQNVVQWKNTSMKLKEEVKENENTSSCPIPGKTNKQQAYQPPLESFRADPREMFAYGQNPESSELYIRPFVVWPLLMSQD